VVGGNVNVVDENGNLVDENGSLNFQKNLQRNCFQMKENDWIEIVGSHENIHN
jgi:hypothetical protein